MFNVHIRIFDDSYYFWRNGDTYSWPHTICFSLLSHGHIYSYNSYILYRWCLCYQIQLLIKLAFQLVMWYFSMHEICICGPDAASKYHKYAWFNGRSSVSGDISCVRVMRPDIYLDHSQKLCRSKIWFELNDYWFWVLARHVAPFLAAIFGFCVDTKHSVTILTTYVRPYRHRCYHIRVLRPNSFLWKFCVWTINSLGIRAKYGVVIYGLITDINLLKSMSQQYYIRETFHILRTGWPNQNKHFDGHCN